MAGKHVERINELKASLKQPGACLFSTRMLIDLLTMLDAIDARKKNQ